MTVTALHLPAYAARRRQIRLNAVYRTRQQASCTEHGQSHAMLAPGDDERVLTSSARFVRRRTSRRSAISRTRHLRSNDHHFGNNARALPTTLGPVTTSIAS